MDDWDDGSNYDSGEDGELFSDLEDIEDDYIDDLSINAGPISEKQINSNIEENDEDNEEDEDDDSNLVEEDDESQIPLPSDNEIYKKNIRQQILKIKEHKKDNICNFSTLGLVSLVCHIVYLLKNGGQMIDGKTNFDYPNITEESYAMSSILLGTHPFEYIVNNQKITIKPEELVLVMKLVFRPVGDNKTYFFTKNFTNTFPIFTKNLLENNVSEELEEIREVKDKSLDKVLYNQSTN